VQIYAIGISDALENWDKMTEFERKQHLIKVAAQMKDCPEFQHAFLLSLNKVAGMSSDELMAILAANMFMQVRFLTEDAGLLDEIMGED